MDSLIRKLHIKMMVIRIIVLGLCVVTINTMSIGNNVSAKQNVKKRETKSGEFYPDWVPFKNKNGEVLSELQAAPKAKPKKRLALPANFVLKAVVEPQNDDYFDKGEAGGDSDDYYDKKEWSDTNRLAQPDSGKTQQLNHTEISDIGGVVGILTKPKNDPLLAAQTIAEDSGEEKADEEDDDSKQKNEQEQDGQKEKEKSTTEANEEDEDDSTEKVNAATAEKEKSETEAKKAKILGSVDDLKERHAEEQRLISEKVREEEEFERDRILLKDAINKFNDDDDPLKPKKPLVDYDEEDEEAEILQHEKYDEPMKVKITTSAPTPKPKPSKKRRPKSSKNVETGKASVFKNPDLFVASDYEDNTEAATVTTTKKPRRVKSKKTKQQSKSRSRSPPQQPIEPTADANENVRISLVPQENTAQVAEPALFFPKKRKNKSRRKLKATPKAQDSHVEETKSQKTAKNFTTPATKHSAPESSSDIAIALMSSLSLSPDTSASNTAPTAVDSKSADTLTTAAETAPSAQDAASTDAVTDAVPASTDHKKDVNEDYDNEKGGAKEYRSVHAEEHGEQGKKAYEGYHEDSKNSKGHHEEEDHSGEYKDRGGVDELHHDEKEHYGDHHHEEHGKKHAKYEESGKHSKGHSTKGSHDIHKKEEYEKKVEFFEEDGDSSDEEKFGGFNDEREHKSGGHFKKGKLDTGHHEHHKGDAGHFGKGGHAHGHKGHKAAEGHDGHGQHHKAQYEGHGHQSGKKWVYHHGKPGKTANLISVDRRFDKYGYGPLHYS